MSKKLWRKNNIWTRKKVLHAKFTHEYLVLFFSMLFVCFFLSLFHFLFPVNSFFVAVVAAGLFIFLLPSFVLSSLFFDPHTFIDTINSCWIVTIICIIFWLIGRLLIYDKAAEADQLCRHREPDDFAQTDFHCAIQTPTASQRGESERRRRIKPCWFHSTFGMWWWVL